MKLQYRKKSLLSRTANRATGTSYQEYLDGGSLSSDSRENPLNQASKNQVMNTYEVETKASFDDIENVIRSADSLRGNSAEIVSLVKSRLNINFDSESLAKLESSRFDFNDLYCQSVFAKFIDMSEVFFKKDPLHGQNKAEAEQKFKELGFHAVGIATCSDGRLAHLVSYALRLPYTLVRRKSHAGVLFDISESVRNWVFVEHERFRSGAVSSVNDPTKYLKIAVYHYSKSEPLKQGCAAHGSDDVKAAEAAKSKLKDFSQAIENRFGCSSSVQTLLIGLNTDDDSLKIHVPNKSGKVCLDRYIDTSMLFHQTNDMNAKQARLKIKDSILECNSGRSSTVATESMQELVAWFVENNFSQIAYVNQYEKGCYSDIGHAERFIGVGNGFEEVQLRNLSYYAYLDTVEEGINDLNVGIKIFTGLNLKKGLPIPIIIRCNYDGRVPGSRERASIKAARIENALHVQYEDLSANKTLQTLCTLRDYKSNQPAEKLLASDYH